MPQSLDAAFHLKTKCLNLISSSCGEMTCQYICSLSVSDLVMLTFLFSLGAHLGCDTASFSVEGLEMVGGGRDGEPWCCERLAVRSALTELRGAGWPSGSSAQIIHTPACKPAVSRSPRSLTLRHPLSISPSRSLALLFLFTSSENPLARPVPSVSTLRRLPASCAVSPSP